MVSTGSPGIGKTRSLYEIEEIITSACRADPGLQLQNHTILPIFVKFNNDQGLTKTDYELGGAGSLYTRIFYSYFLQPRQVSFEKFQENLRPGTFSLDDLFKKIQKTTENKDIIIQLQLDEIQNCFEE